jgi:AcrR family transcriptional regulator
VTTNKDRVAKTKKQIIVASVKVLNEKGRDRFSTTAVAEQAGVSIGTLYRYYADRVDLLDVVDPDRDKAAERIRAALEYIDKSFDNVGDLDAEMKWENAEVLEMLADIRSTLTSGVVASEHRVSETELVDPQ